MRKPVYLFLIYAISFIYQFTGLAIYCQQPNLEWAARYTGSPGYEQHINDAITDKNGNTYVCGFILLPNQNNTKDAITIKINAFGNIEWIQVYSGENNGQDEAKAIVIDNQGNIIITGFSFVSGSSIDYLTIKYDPSGDSAWSRRYNGLGNNTDDAYDIAVDSLNCIYVTGYSIVPSQNTDYATIKYDSFGDLQWIRHYNGLSSLSDVGRRITIDSDDNILVSGLSSRGFSINDVVTIKYNSLGETLWTSTYSGINNGGADGSMYLQTDTSNNIYFVTGVPGGPIRIVKYDENGDSLWIKPLPTGVFSSALQVRQNDFYLASRSSGDYLTYRFNMDGDTLWKRLFPVQTYTSSDVSTDAVCDKYGNVYVTGYCDSNWLVNDYLTVKYDSSGNLKWAKRYSLELFADDKAYKIGIDTLNSLYVTGISGGQITTIKYSQPPVGVIQTGNEVPEVYKLFQNYPNPFNPTTEIKFELPQNTFVTLKVYNAVGQVVAELVNNEYRNAGSYSVSFDGSKFASGIYFYSIEAGVYKDIKKMVLIK